MSIAWICDLCKKMVEDKDDLNGAVHTLKIAGKNFQVNVNIVMLTDTEVVTPKKEQLGSNVKVQQSLTQPDLCQQCQETIALQALADFNERESDGEEAEL